MKLSKEKIYEVGYKFYYDCDNMTVESIETGFCNMIGENWKIWF